MTQKNRDSERGCIISPRIFTISSVILQNEKQDDPVFRFMDKKRAEGKHFYVYTVAGAARFLRIYYARVKKYLDMLEGDLAKPAYCPRTFSL